jgi:hypothetical protein
MRERKNIVNNLYTFLHINGDFFFTNNLFEFIIGLCILQYYIFNLNKLTNYEYTDHK